VYSTNITTTTTVRGGEGSRRWRLAKEQTSRFSALRPNLRHYSYSMCTVPILRLLPQHEEVKGVGVGVSRYRPNFLALQLQYVYSTDNTTITKAKGVDIGVSRRDKRRNSRHYDVNQIYNWRRQYVYRTKITISPDNDRVFDWINSYTTTMSGDFPLKILW